MAKVKYIDVRKLSISKQDFISALKKVSGKVDKSGPSPKVRE